MPTLFIKFKNEAEFAGAKEWFQSSGGSDYCADEVNKEFRSLGFECLHQAEVDELEKALDEEMLKNTSFENYYFESE